MQSTEKRKLERFNLEIPATASIAVAGAEPEKLDLKTRDVCSGGAYFKTEQSPPIGTEMQIRLVLPMEKFRALPVDCEKVVVNLSGKVLRIGPDGIGVCFDTNFDIRPV
jgi:PilZ domain-containing protein